MQSSGHQIDGGFRQLANMRSGKALGFLTIALCGVLLVIGSVATYRPPSGPPNPPPSQPPTRPPEDRESALGPIIDFPPGSKLGPLVDLAPEPLTLPEEIRRLYTQHATVSAGRRTIRLSVVPDFSAEDHAAILVAAAEWNHVLNGHIRFVVGSSDDPVSLAAAAPAGPETVLIVKAAGDFSYNQQGPQPVALTLMMDPGGMMMVYTERLSQLDLKRVMLHEIGHVLHLAHDTKSRLMYPRYFGDYQKCVDEVTAGMVSAVSHIPVQELNWCG
jgi:hypothetical protein